MGLKRGNKVSAEFSMSSLTDIIFLLLIFFILTSTLVSPNALKLKLPTSKSKVVIDAPVSIPVSITRNGEWYVDGEKTRKSKVRALVTERVNKALKAKKTRKQITIPIVAETGVPIENVVTVMDIALELRIGVILATDPVKNG